MMQLELDRAFARWTEALAVANAWAAVTGRRRRVVRVGDWWTVIEVTQR